MKDGINKELKKGKIIRVLLMGHMENGACQSSLLQFFMEITNFSGER